MEFQAKDFFPTNCLTHNMFGKEKSLLLCLLDSIFDFILL